LACALATFGENNPKKASLAVIARFPDPGVFEVKTCTQCGECAEVCPADAIPQNELGAYYIDPERCTGCLLCVDACPEGVVFTTPGRDAPFECTLCGDCVAACGTNALWIE
jgi:ferredoxin